MKIATVAGEDWFALPDGLYIPPDALRVFLERFEGPLDLLLFLIRKQKIDILDIPVAKITQQYLEYMQLMQDVQLELAGDYLLMAAMLAEIKSRLLLPRPPSVVSEEVDPRAELVRRLQEYEQFKTAAEQLDALPRLERDAWAVQITAPELPRRLPEVVLTELLQALHRLQRRQRVEETHAVQREILSIRERMTYILQQLQMTTRLDFTSLITSTEGRLGVVVSFIAVLELLKSAAIDVVQTESFAPLYISTCHE